MATPQIIPTEARLKSRLANKIALLAEDRDLGGAEVAKATGLNDEQVGAILNGFVADLDLYTIMKALTAMGVHLTLQVSEAENAVGALMTDLNDAA